MDGTVREPVGPGASLRLQVPPEAKYGRYVRERVACFAASHDIPEADVIPFVSAVAEALANALEHARSEDPIEVSCWIDGADHLLARVVDFGVGFEPAEPPVEPKLPGVLSERGRGLPIMKHFTDLLTVSSAPGQGTAVMLGRYVRRAARTVPLPVPSS